MSYSADESYDVYDETLYRARKLHTCDACERAIKPGHYYWRIYMLFDGRKESLKRCGACQRTHVHLRDLCSGNDMWPDERLGCGLDYREEWGDDPPSEVQALALMGDDEAGDLYSPLARLREWVDGAEGRMPVNIRYPCVSCGRRIAEERLAEWCTQDTQAFWCWLEVDGACDARHVSRVEVAS